MCSSVIAVNTAKSAGAHLVASNLPPRPVSRIKYLGCKSAAITMAVKKVVSKNVGLIDSCLAVPLTVFRAPSNWLGLTGTPFTLTRSSIRHRCGDEKKILESPLRVIDVASSEHRVPLPLLPAT